MILILFSWVKGANLGGWIVEIDILCGHDLQKNFEGDDEVGIDDSASLQAFICWETSGVDDAHLLYDGGFARFSGA